MVSHTLLSVSHSAAATGITSHTFAAGSAGKGGGAAELLADSDSGTDVDDSRRYFLLSLPELYTVNNDSEQRQCNSMYIHFDRKQIG